MGRASDQPGAGKGVGVDSEAEGPSICDLCASHLDLLEDNSARLDCHSCGEQSYHQVSQCNRRQNRVRIWGGKQTQ